MKILIADDSNEKVSRLIAVLDECGIVREGIRVAYTLFDAKRELREFAFDLLILDVLLPLRGGESPSHLGTIDLLTELSDRSTLHKPRYIVGLTAFDQAVRDAGPAFIGRTWTVIKFTPEIDAWKEQIKACVRYIAAANRERAGRRYKTDLCIVVALPVPEMDAITRLDWNWGSPEPIDDNTFVTRGHFLCSGSTFTTVAACASRTGMVSSALLAAKLIEHEVPRFVVMPGICAGIDGKTNLGDVVVADPTWDWQSGKHLVEASNHIFAIAPDPIGLATFVRARFEQLRSAREVWSSMRAGWPNPPDTELKLRIGPMASGSSVLADQDVVQAITAQNRNLTAVEMESFGVAAAAAWAGHPRPTAFVCKAVCDFADEEKDDTWQAYAAYCSAQAVKLFFERYMAEIVELAGTR